MSILPPRDLLSLRRADVVTNLEDKMDGFKSATGLSNSSTDDSSQNDSFQKSKSQSGEEPLSGVKGQGTVEEPYDAGNQEGELRVRFDGLFFCLSHDEVMMVGDGVGWEGFERGLCEELIC